MENSYPECPPVVSFHESSRSKSDAAAGLLKKTRTCHDMNSSTPEFQFDDQQSVPTSLSAENVAHAKGSSGNRI